MNANAPRELVFELPDEAASALAGAALGRALNAGDTVLLGGPVGAGKTTMARAAILARLERPEDVPSPTFTLVQVYEADVPIWHADLYRLSDADELEELGLFDALQDVIAFIQDATGDWPPASWKLD